MKKITITQRRSVIGSPQSVKATMKALGLRKLNQSITHNATPSITGMIRRVGHLIDYKTQD